MSKPPKEQARDYVWHNYGEGDFNEHNWDRSAEEIWLAGYEAAKEQLADTGKVMNSPEKLDSWISVKERLPEVNEEVLVFGKILNAPKLLGVRYRVLGDQEWKYTWEGDGYIFKQDYVTHWMPLPEPPKEEK